MTTASLVLIAGNVVMKLASLDASKNKSKMKHRVICRYGHNYISPLGGCHPTMNFQRNSEKPKVLISTEIEALVDSLFLEEAQDE